MSLVLQILRILKKVGYVLFPLMVLSLTWEQFTTEKIYIEMNQSEAGHSLLWFWGFLSLINGFFAPVLMLLITVYALEEKLQKLSWFTFLRSYLAPTLIETLRAWGKVIWGFIFFLVPGVWLHVKYTFVPFVVLESSEYNLGHQDALSESSKLTGKRMGQILILLFTFNIFIPLLMTQLFDDYRTLWKTPLWSLTLSFIDTLFYILFTLLFYKLYQQTKKEVQ